MIIAGGTGNHIHILISLGRADLTVLIGDIKRESSKWMKDNGVTDFYWQRGYGAFSIGESQIEGVSNYILTQKEHHAERSFEEEYRAWCRTYSVEIDERYCWD